MLESFSSQYLLGRFHAYPDNRSKAALSPVAHEKLSNYIDDYTVVFKIDNQHFPVTRDPSVSGIELVLPVDLLESLNLDLGFEPEPTTVLVARDDTVRQTLGMVG